MSDKIFFSVNGKKCSVGSEVDSDVSLTDYLRNYLNLRGTKYMCKEGNCGSCIVAVTVTDHNGHHKTFSVNSCLVSITSCQDWNITTIEGIGNRQGYHPVQRTLAEYNGTQCGFCSPGWVMSMYSLLEANNYALTKAQIEDSFGSNTCRCTGFRPILDAFKSFAQDNSKPILIDIEDLKKCKKKVDCTAQCDSSWCVISKKNIQDILKKIKLKDGRIWYRVNEISEILDIFNKEGKESYMLINGNTGKGPSPIFAYPRVLIDISPVLSLKTYYIDQNLVIGGGVVLTDMMDIFRIVSESKQDFWYLRKFIEHIQLVAHIPVRNIGTVAGNLMIKHKQPTFASDIFLLFEAVGATVTIIDEISTVETTLVTFLTINMTGKIITQIKLPPLSHRHKFVSFKVMPRSQNAFAQVNAAFLYELDSENLVESANIVIGGLSPKFIHASKTEGNLRGKKLFTNETLQESLLILENEIIAEEIRGTLKPEYRKKCVLGLFYKGLLNIIPENMLKPQYRSGARDLRKTRPVSKASEDYDTNRMLWPLNEPMPRLEALSQCSGETFYINDLPTQMNEVFCAFVTSEICVGEIESIDASAALKIPGVLAFYSAKDIPGKNSFTPLNIPGNLAVEELFVDRFVKHYDQPIGVIVAETEKLAQRAALLVKVKYANVKPRPILTIVHARLEPGRVTPFIVYPARDHGMDVQRVFKGDQNLYWQYVYHMETQTCITKPNDDGLDVFPSTQWPDQVHIGISQLLNIEQSRINITVPRCGGAFGAKISRNGQISCACALVTFLTNQPCRFVMSVQANIRSIGQRNPSMADYEVGVNRSGVIQYLEYQLYVDNGYMINDPILTFGVAAIKNCYDNRRWQYKLFNVTTDNPKTTYARSPGAIEAIATIETLMERIAYEVNMDPLQVRQNNLNAQYTDVAEVIQTVIEDSEYQKRKVEVENFNKQNRWKKKGLRVAFMSWPASSIMDFNVLITVYHGDASVVIRHSGVEIGQGVNTKIVQVVAYTLQISVDKVKIKPLDVSVNPNTFTTGGSRTSQSVCFAAVKCCQLLLDRLSTIRDTLNNPSWEVLIAAAYSAGINLQTSYRVTPNDENPHRSAGAAVVEVEVDMLTGEHDILRVDIIEDVGLSINPEIDIGQIEGAFTMGIGYWTCEHHILDEGTGEILTDRPWYYHVPLAKDIPIDFRIKLRKNSFNPIATFGARGVSEPAICLAVCVSFALREAIVSSREETGYVRTEWFNVDGPFTLEEIVLKADVNLKEFMFY